MTFEKARGTPPKVERLVPILQSATTREIIEAFAQVRRLKSIEFAQITARETEIDKITELERQKRAESRRRHKASLEREPRRVLQAIYDFKSGYTEQLEKYQRMTPTQLKALTVQIPPYDPPKPHLGQVKADALKWLNHLRLAKEAEIEPETPQKKSMIDRMLHR